MALSQPIRKLNQFSYEESYVASSGEHSSFEKSSLKATPMTPSPTPQDKFFFEDSFQARSVVTPPYSKFTLPSSSATPSVPMKKRVSMDDFYMTSFPDDGGDFFPKLSSTFDQPRSMTKRVSMENAFMIECDSPPSSPKTVQKLNPGVASKAAEQKNDSLSCHSKQERVQGREHNDDMEIQCYAERIEMLSKALQRIKAANLSLIQDNQELQEKSHILKYENSDLECEFRRLQYENEELRRRKAAKQAAKYSKQEQMTYYKRNYFDYDAEEIHIPDTFSKDEFEQERKMIATMKNGAKGNDFEDVTKKRPAEDHETDNSLDDAPDFSDWNTGFQYLLDFKEKHGHCRVPRPIEGGCEILKCLRTWVLEQRQNYDEKEKGVVDVKVNALTNERIKLLDVIGFQWVVESPEEEEEEVVEEEIKVHEIQPKKKRSKINDNRQKAWDEQFERLKEFKAKHGHCDVRRPRSKKEADSCEWGNLGIWVKTQRRQYGQFMEGKQSNITQERVDQLTAIGFNWRLRKYNGRDSSTESQTKGGEENDTNYDSDVTESECSSN